MLAITAIVGATFCMKTILYACAKTLGLVRNLTQVDDQTADLNLLLLKSDIKKKIAKTHKLLMDIENENLKDSVKLAIMDVNESIYIINELLEDCLFIKNKHRELYLGNWRSMDMGDVINKLTIQIDIFNIRFNDLLNIITIVNCFK